MRHNKVWSFEEDRKNEILDEIIAFIFGAIAAGATLIFLPFLLAEILCR